MLFSKFPNTLPQIQKISLNVRKRLKIYIPSSRKMYFFSNWTLGDVECSFGTTAEKKLTKGPKVVRSMSADDEKIISFPGKNLFLKMFLWTITTKNWSSRWKSFDEGPECFGSLSEYGSKHFFSEKKPKLILWTRRLQVLPTLFKKFSTKVDQFVSNVRWRSENIVFLEMSFYSKISPLHVERSFDNAVDDFFCKKRKTFRRVSDNFSRKCPKEIFNQQKSPIM